MRRLFVGVASDGVAPVVSAFKATSALRLLTMVLMASALLQACTGQQRSNAFSPSAVDSNGAESGFASVSGKQSVDFPPRNEPFAFRQDLETKYRDGLHRGASSSYVDIEGTIVWTQEYLRYRVNGCDHNTAVQKVFAQLDGAGVAPVCGSSPSATAAFPPRNEPFDFRNQLEAKYRDGLRRSPTPTFVDVEGDIVWTQEYLRYRVSSCGHADAESKVFAQIDGRGVQTDCTPAPPPPAPAPAPAPPPSCTAAPGVPGFLGWTTAGLPSGSIQFFWGAAAGMVTSYVVELGTTPGATNVRVVDTGSAATSYTFAGLTPGDYYARVRAKNSCGVSGPSNEAIPRVR